jgi:hypothetical protein
MPMTSSHTAFSAPWPASSPDTLTLGVFSAMDGLLICSKIGLAFLAAACEFEGNLAFN